MLTLLGPKTSYCDGLSRRMFLKIGGLSMSAVGGVGLPTILRAESASSSAKKSRQRAVINVFLAGGPPHQDMWEIKTEAPKDVRGDFSPISTKVPGIQIGECFPKIAAMMDKFAIIRSVVGCVDNHDGYQCLSGWPRRDSVSIGGRPSIGSIVAKVQGAVEPSIPPFVALADRTSHEEWSEPGAPGFLGSAYQAFKPSGQGMTDLRLNGVTLDRLQDRKALLRGLDDLKRSSDATGMLAGMDAFSEAAFGVLTSSKLADALDLNKEDPRIVARYGDGKPFNFQYDGAPTVNHHLLIARRLVEAGVRCVTLSYGRWDSHGDNFGLVRDHGPKLDQAVTALVQDLEERGLLETTTVVVWGEFGRSPRINQGAGRDHWPRVSCALLAGGGMRTGQAIGATNRLGEYAVSRPVHMQQIVATIYSNLGIDPNTTTVTDPTGRPRYLVDIREPVQELA
jgi:hypothetical protein